MDEKIYTRGTLSETDYGPQKLAEARAERDEARGVARQFFEAAKVWGQFPPGGQAVWTDEMLARWPWLKEGE